MICDFHTHTFLSDGELSPLELIHRAVKQGYRAIAITDHAGSGQLERFITELTKDCLLAEKYWDIIAIPGVELTHLPVSAINDTAKQARDMGARFVVMHGQTITEPVEPGTNMAAARSSYIDLIAHPGFITLEEATAAKENNVFIEISARSGHSLTNGHIAQISTETEAKLLLGSDAHDEGDLLNLQSAANVLYGASLTKSQVDEILHLNPSSLLKKLKRG